eukprot:CAMPEP_0181323014 /NCGR_PEP_ID=MMETSP1101-20121128/19545_1 /TAXON_ID=46948 /ORGANISM="Rhodomonas abbreviata, Strain Caron Lab Isolate" /LENGTH=171 /DNA_ID=CAMNT_0023430985 /DNA_START=42 /DNA_END=560 /DNA_ORIENTATION=+
MCSVDEAIASLVPKGLDDFMLQLLSDNDFHDDMPVLLCPDTNSSTEQAVFLAPDPMTHGNNMSVDHCDAEGSSESTTVAGRLPSPRGVKRSQPWTTEEQTTFLRGLAQHCPEGTKLVGRHGSQSVGLGPGIAQIISNMIGTRSAAQVRSHAQKHFQRIRRQRKVESPAESS